MNDLVLQNNKLHEKVQKTENDYKNIHDALAKISSVISPGSIRCFTSEIESINRFVDSICESVNHSYNEKKQLRDELAKLRAQQVPATYKISPAVITNPNIKNFFAATSPEYFNLSPSKKFENLESENLS